MTDRDLPQDEIELTMLIRNNRMKRLRLEERLTQKQLGDSLGIGSQTIGAAEKFENVAPEKLQKIADYFKVDKEWLFPHWAMGQFQKTRVVHEIPREGLLQSGRDAETRLMLPDPSKKIESQELAERIERVLQTLSFREREIIRLRKGIPTGYTHTLEDVGKIFKITRTRVRQIEAKAIRKLQHPMRARKLKGFIESVEEETDE